MFKCTRCNKMISKVSDVRGCYRCGSRASAIPSSYSSHDSITPAILGYLVGSSHSAHEDPPFVGGGGLSGGAGAGGSWDSTPDFGNVSSGSSSSSDYSSSSSYDSGSSSSSDSGSSGGGGSD